jgi:thioredoxin 1
MISLTEETFDSIKKDPICLVYFWATWSGPCLNCFGLDEFEKENPEFPVYKVNVEENQELARKHSIIVIPTLMVFKKGKSVKTLIGTQLKHDLNRVLKEL